MSELYTKEFIEAFKDSPNYVHFDDQWRWQIPLPEKVDLEWVGEALREHLEKKEAPNIEGIVRKSEEAPTSIPTDPHIWMTEKEIHEEKFWGSRQHCSYCDYTPCRCKNEDI